MGEIERLSQEAGLRVANVFHAGDGNLTRSFLRRRVPASRRPPKRYLPEFLNCASKRVALLPANMVSVWTKRK